MPTDNPQTPASAAAPTLDQIRAAWATLSQPGVRLIDRFPPFRIHALSQQEGLDYLGLMVALRYVKPPAPQSAPALAAEVLAELDKAAEYLDCLSGDVSLNGETALNNVSEYLDSAQRKLRHFAHAPAPQPAPPASAEVGLRAGVEALRDRFRQEEEAPAGHESWRAAMQAARVALSLLLSSHCAESDAAHPAPAEAGVERARLEAERDLHDRLCSEHSADRDRWYAHLMLMQVATDRLRLLNVEEHHQAALAQAQAGGEDEA